MKLNLKFLIDSLNFHFAQKAIGKGLDLLPFFDEIKDLEIKIQQHFKHCKYGFCLIIFLMANTLFGICLSPKSWLSVFLIFWSISNLVISAIFLSLSMQRLKKNEARCSSLKFIKLAMSIPMALFAFKAFGKQ